MMVPTRVIQIPAWVPAGSGLLILSSVPDLLLVTDFDAFGTSILVESFYQSIAVTQAKGIVRSLV
jgi:hypothetical protein